MSKIKKRSKHSKQRIRPSGWFTSDADEIERRRERGTTGAFQIDPLSQDDDFFGAYQINSATEQAYRVEIRSLSEPINSCNCPDHRINGLGTCKHIEAALNRLQYRRKRAFKDAAGAGSPHVEIFLDRRDHQIRIAWPTGSHQRSKASELLAPFFADDKVLIGNPLDKLPAMQGKSVPLIGLSNARSDFPAN